MVLRVLLDDRMDRGGVGRYGRDLLAAMKRIDDVDAVGVRDRSRNTPAPFTPWGRRHVARAAQKVSCDLVHGLHLELPSNLRLPSVVTVHDIIPLEFRASMPGRLRRLVFHRVIERSLSLAERVIVPSESTRSSLIGNGADGAKLTVVPNGVSDGFRPLTPSEDGIAKDRFAGGRRYVAALVHPKPHKNSRVLAEVGPILSDDPGVPLVCAGETMNAPGIVDAGVLIDEALRLFYGGAEVLVLPSLTEGFGLPALEALACGTPVVCGKGVGAFDYLEAAMVEANPTSAEDLARAAGEVVRDDALRHRLREEGLALARRFTSTRMANETLKVYRDVLARA